MAINYSYRDYQEHAIFDTLRFWETKPGRSPIIEAPTGSGKSLISCGVPIEAMNRYGTKLKTVIIVPSKELCIQNAEKASSMAPAGVTVDMYSASVGRKNPLADIVCATVGSIAKNAHEFGHVDIVGIDECHRVNPDGKGDYWQFINDLQKNGPFRMFGLTATPFRGNGVWLTDGNRPAFHGFSYKIKLLDLLNRGFLSPLVNPPKGVAVRIKTDDIKMSGSDFNVHDLAERTAEYLITAAKESVVLAAERKKWIAFLPDIGTASEFCSILNSMGITTGLVTGKTPDKEREYLIDQFKKGYLRCLVTVLALSTGFDVPGIDCILWLRSTHSLVLYTQGAGRGLRICDGKSDCLWLDFTDTTERLGPLDKITGRKKKRTTNDHAPFVVCDNCGVCVSPASAIYCPECGNTLREIENIEARYASDAEILEGLNPEPTFPCTHISVTEELTQYGKKYLMVKFFNCMAELCREPIFFSGISISPPCVEFWIMLTGDSLGQYNNYTACARFLNQRLGESKSLYITGVKVDRTKKYPKLLQILRNYDN